MQHLVALEIFDKIFQKCRSEIAKQQIKQEKLFFFVLVWILEKNHLFTQHNSNQDTKKSQNELSQFLLKQVQLKTAKRDQQGPYNNSERECIYSKYSKQRQNTDRTQSGQHGVVNVPAESNISSATTADQTIPDTTQDLQKQQLQNVKIPPCYLKYEKNHDYEQTIRSQSPLDESCLIFSENNIRKRMALSISRDEDQNAGQNGNVQKGIQNKLSSNTDSIIPIQFKFAIEKEKIYEQNLKLLKQSPNTQSYISESQKQSGDSKTSNNNNLLRNSIQQLNNNTNEERKNTATNISYQSPRMELYPIFTMNSGQKEQQSNQINMQNNQTITCSTPPLLPSTIVNVPQYVQNGSGQQLIPISLNNTVIQNICNNTENTPNFKLTPTRIVAPPNQQYQIQQNAQQQQIPTINTNISVSNNSISSNMSSHRSMKNSNGKGSQYQQGINQSEAESAITIHDPTKKQLNGLFQQFSNTQQFSPSQQKFYTPSPTDYNISKYNYATICSYPQMSPPQAYNFSDLIHNQKDNSNCLPLQQQQYKIAHSGEIYISQNSNPVFNIQIPQNQNNFKEESSSSDTQRWNNASSNLMKANSTELENANNTSANDSSNNNQHSSTSKKYKTKSTKVPSDDTYNYIQTLFEIDESHSTDSNASNSRILQNSSNYYGLCLYTEKEKLNEETAVAASLSLINSNSSTSLKNIKSLSNAIMEDENVMAEKSKQKLKEKQLIYLGKELSQNKKVQSLELKDDKNKLIMETNYCSQSSYIRQQCKIDESGEANPVFANFASKKRLSLILQQSLIQKNEEFQVEMLTPKNVEYETCSSLDMNEQ